jgi:hypothetical protein
MMATAKSVIVCDLDRVRPTVYCKTANCGLMNFGTILANAEFINTLIYVHSTASNPIQTAVYTFCVCCGLRAGRTVIAAIKGDCIRTSRKKLY